MPKKTIQSRTAAEPTATGADGLTLPPLPEARLGILLAASLLFADLTGTIVGDFGLHVFRLFVLIVGAAYWLFCVHRLHLIVRQLEPGYPISPAAAVGWHFPPFASLFWIFKWPIELSRFINRRGQVKIMPGGWIGLIIFGCVTLGQAFWGLGMATLFLATWYMADKLSFETRYYAVELPPLAEPPAEQVALGVLAGNVSNYLVANTGFVFLLLLLAGDAADFLLLGAIALIFVASGFASGLAAGIVGHRFGPGIGIPANLAALGSLAVGVYVWRQYGLTLIAADFVILPLLLIASFFFSVAGTRIGEGWHQQRRYPYLWLIEPADISLKRKVLAGRPEASADGLADSIPADVPVDRSQLVGGVALGNVTALLVLLFYEYPVAVIEFIWGDHVYFVSRLADGLIIVTGAFVAAYVAMLVAKSQPRAMGLAANLIMYLTILALFFRAVTGGDFWGDFGAVIPFIPVVIVAGLFGARAAEASLQARLPEKARS